MLWNGRPSHVHAITTWRIFRENYWGEPHAIDCDLTLFGSRSANQLLICITRMLLSPKCRKMHEKTVLMPCPHYLKGHTVLVCFHCWTPNVRVVKERRAGQEHWHLEVAAGLLNWNSKWWIVGAFEVMDQQWSGYLERKRFKYGEIHVYVRDKDKRV